MVMRRNAGFHVASNDALAAGSALVRTVSTTVENLKQHQVIYIANTRIQSRGINMLLCIRPVREMNDEFEVSG